MVAGTGTLNLDDAISLEDTSAKAMIVWKR
jgi:hypothetical protein